MMLKISQNGRSMVEMLAVLAIIGVLSAGGLAGYGKAMYKYELSKTISITSQALQDFAFFKNRGVSGYSATKANMAETARSSGLMSDCRPMQSQIASGYGVCQAPLGEIYPRFFISTSAGDQYYTYMLYVTLLKNMRVACMNFLAQNWDQALPQKFWRLGKIWITSNKGSQVIYSGGSGGISVASTITPCKNVCGDGATYCSVVFDFSGYAN